MEVAKGAEGVRHSNEAIWKVRVQVPYVQNPQIRSMSDQVGNGLADESDLLVGEG